MQRPQPPARLGDPVAQGRAVEGDALPAQDRGLAVQRQAVTVLRHQHLHEQRLGWQAADDGVLRRRPLMDAVAAAAAGVARPDGDAHPQLRRHHVEPLRPGLADPVHLASATGAAAVGEVEDPFDPLEMRRQDTAVPAPGRHSPCGFAVGAGASFAGDGSGGSWPSVRASCAGSMRSAVCAKRAR